VVELTRLRDQILRLAGENRALTAGLLHDELGKVEALGASFTELVLSSRRYRSYLASVDLDGLERELREQERRLAAGKDGERPSPAGRAGGPDEFADLARKNLAILQKRREKLGEMKDHVSRAEAQMDLVENTFRLLADQILTMRSPAELSGQLDDLIDGVEAVRSTAREAEALLEATP
jgi:DNA repair exonuclease SbcCD ATPase subunit